MADEVFIYFAGLTEAAHEILEFRTRLNSILVQYRAVIKRVKPGLFPGEGMLGRLESELEEYGRALEKHRVFLLQTRDAYIQAEGRRSGAAPLPVYLGGPGGNGGMVYAWAGLLLPRIQAAPIGPALKACVCRRLEGYGGDNAVDAERL